MVETEIQTTAAEDHEVVEAAREAEAAALAQPTPATLPAAVQSRKSEPQKKYSRQVLVDRAGRKKSK